MLAISEIIFKTSHKIFNLALFSERFPVGTQVKIYSNKKKEWVAGVVTEIHEKGHIHVHYGSRRKWIKPDEVNQVRVTFMHQRFFGK